MKKIILFLMLLVSIMVHAQEVNGIHYSTEIVSYYGGTKYEATVVSSPTGNRYSGDIVIPSSIIYGGKTYSVTSIDTQTFAYCKNLTSVSIPNSMNSIGPMAFEGCSSLISITIPNSVTSINFYAFRDCI